MKNLFPAGGDAKAITPAVAPVHNYREGICWYLLYQHICTVDDTV